MKKKWISLLLTVTLISGLTACGQGDTPGQSGTLDGSSVVAESTEPSSEGPVEKDDSKYRVGGTVSDAYVDPSKHTVSGQELKAQGFEYDKESLTYELVWNDEFDYEGEPDPEKWGYDVGGGGWGNNELQYYTKAENASVADGVLTIQARKEQVGFYEYTSSRLVTRQKGDWLYCKVEVSAKLPKGKGTWPAIWMLPTDWDYGDWPASGEIDIMEHVGYDQDVIVQSVHSTKYHATNSKSGSYKVEGVSDEFHTYTVEWLPDKIIFGVDGEEKYTYDPNKLSKQPTKAIWPYDKRMHLLINLAFGGDWGGARGVDDSYFPVDYYIDYVRVYQSPEIMELTGQTLEKTE